MSVLKAVVQFLLIIGSLSFIGSLGCATRAAQTDRLKTLVSALPQQHSISNVEFIDQDTNLCGPATMTMSLRWNGVDVEKDYVAEKVFTPGLDGSLPSDMISASRRFGMIPIPVNTLESLLTEIAANNPVIVFQNLTLSWAPQWHYALAVGYDLTQQKIILHTGHNAYSKMDLRDFEFTWKQADYWGLVVLSPDKISASGNELDHVKAAVALEKMNKLPEASIAYRRILEKWPNSLVALMGAGNLAYQSGNRKQAVHWFRRAVDFHPESIAAKKNLSVAVGK